MKRGIGAHGNRQSLMKKGKLLSIEREAKFRKTKSYTFVLSTPNIVLK